MMHVPRASLAVLAGATLFTSVVHTEHLPVIASAWRAEPIVVDGRLEEWSSLMPVEAAKLAVAVANDDRRLYLAVSASDQAQRRLLAAAGLIVWIDAGGGKKTSFGIRYPGVIGLGFGGRGGPAGRPDERRPDGPPPEPVLPALTWFELVGPGKDDRRRLQRQAVTSLQVGRDLHEGVLAFELEVPLAGDGAASYGIGTAAGRQIGLGLETPPIERPETPATGRDRPGGQGRPGGGGGGMGGGIGRPGGMGGMGRPPGGEGPGHAGERGKPFKFWATVTLAQGGR